MGNYFSRVYRSNTISISEVYNRLTTSRKRKYSSDESDAALEESLNVPKRCKIKSTTDHLYQILFVEGHNHDVILDVLGKEWKLHKLYLIQSPYFNSMFSGSWKEKYTSNIKITIVDPNINLESLNIVFGSLYRDNVEFKTVDVISVLAAASMFQLDELIEKCSMIMLEAISPQTACAYYEAASRYCLKQVTEATVRWFLVNLMTYHNEKPQLLRQISPELMMCLVRHNDLLVVPVEFALYSLLCFWVYLRLHPDWELTADPKRLMSKKFFSDREDPTPFLLTNEGEEFAPVFQSLRLNNLMVNNSDIPEITDDRIMPLDWIYPEILQQWKKLIQVNFGYDKGPGMVSPEVFLAKSARYGRMIKQNNGREWGWMTFNFGVDLSWSVKNNVVSIHRRTSVDNLTDTNPRTIMLRMILYKIDKRRQKIKSVESGIMTFALLAYGLVNDSHRIMDVPPDFGTSYFISINLLAVTPMESESGN